MRRRISVQVLAVFAVFVLMGSCETSEYAKLEKEELAKGIRYDSLFHGLKFGQTKQDFYQVCWDKNKEGVLNAGGYSNFVRYDMSDHDSLAVNDITMYFYPDFDEDDLITGMQVECQYTAWSPWNEHLTAKYLIPVIKDTLMNWYGGNSFIEMPDEDELQTIWVKVDGNRRIAIKAKSEERVQMKIVDLTVAK